MRRYFILAVAVCLMTGEVLAENLRGVSTIPVSTAPSDEDALARPRASVDRCDSGFVLVQVAEHDMCAPAWELRKPRQ